MAEGKSTAEFAEPIAVNEVQEDPKKRELVALMEDIIQLLGTQAFLVFKFAYQQYRQNGDIEEFAKGLHIAFYDPKVASPISLV